MTPAEAQKAQDQSFNDSVDLWFSFALEAFEAEASTHWFKLPLTISLNRCLGYAVTEPTKEVAQQVRARLHLHLTSEGWNVVVRHSKTLWWPNILTIRPVAVSSSP